MKKIKILSGLAAVLMLLAALLLSLPTPEERVLTRQGYQPLREETGTDWTRPLHYTKGPLCVSLGLSDDLERLSSLTVSIAVTNRETVVF